GIVMKQKTVSEENLAIDVVNVMGSIFTGAGVSEQTKNFVGTSGLADYTLTFDCDEGVSTFGIKGQPNQIEDNIQPFFSPSELQTTQLILWSLPYKLPFKVSDFLFVTSVNTKYFIIGNDVEFVNEFLNATEGFNVLYIPQQSLSEINPEKNFQVRLIDLNGLVNTQPVPEKLQSLDDNKVTLITFLDDGKKINYYRKEDRSWKLLNKQGPLQIVSLGGERDAAKYAAIFSANHETYQCNMEKAFQRLKYLLEVYGGPEISRGTAGGKLKEMTDYYLENPELGAIGEPCLSHLQEADFNVLQALRFLQVKVNTCLISYPSTYSSCLELITEAQNLQQANQNLGFRGDCLTLY
ncbi:MAG: hypothetical protein KKH52_00500, partial [Nanoarchaeota archaeon]|nr:hypothetical protein [Nanoarchaeota archaeon]